jgi:heterodisulfide reductase subunit D
MKAATLREHLDAFIADTLARCTQCGKCFEACPMTRYADGLAGTPGPDVVSGVLGLLRQEPGNAPALKWLKVCTQSSRCTEACPEGINAMKMVRVAQMSALGALGGPVQMASREEPHFFRKIGAFSGLQLSPEEIAKWQR